ncbi:MAG: hypothetical protein KC643_20395, partial [Nitrospira sp.]|nr:hypothetical protein [Nitrospira sp.]
MNQRVGADTTRAFNSMREIMHTIATSTTRQLSRFIENATLERGIRVWVSILVVVGMLSWTVSGSQASTPPWTEGPTLLPGPELVLPAPSTFTMVNMGGDLYFVAAPKAQPGDMELWKTNGTVEGTHRVKDIVPGPEGSLPTRLTVAGNLVYFAVGEEELWRSNGTEAGTWRVFQTSNPPQAFKLSMVAAGDFLFFVGHDEEHGVELWKSDGTPKGTNIVKDIVPGTESGEPRALTAVGKRVFFGAYEPAHGGELWLSDGTEEGTQIVKDLQPGKPSSNGLSYLTAVGDLLYFSAAGALWKSDGTEGGTQLLKEHITPRYFTPVGDTVFFQGREDTYGVELWRTDGTPKGTNMLKDIWLQKDSGNPEMLIGVGGMLVFRATDPIHGGELWRTDGTEAGTTLVKDIFKDLPSGNPINGTNIGGLLLFSANAEGLGRELWVTDGTSEQTVPVHNFAEGARHGNPQVFPLTARRAVIAANDEKGNRRLWTMTLHNTPPQLAKIENQSTYDHHTLEPVIVSGKDDLTTFEDLTVTVTSSNPELLPQGNIDIKRRSEEGEFQLSFTPNANASSPVGIATVTVSVSDGQFTTQRSFDVEWYEALVVGESLGNGVEYKTLKEAVNAANAEKLIVVTDGVYTGAGNRNVEVEADKNLTIRSEHGPEQTVIDLEGQGRAFEWKGSGILDGLTLKNASVQDFGGAINIEPRSSEHQSFTINNVMFIHNAASFGGAVSFSQIGSGPATLIIEHCEFYDNTAKHMGGAIFLSVEDKAQTNVTIAHNTFAFNVSSHGGAIYTSTRVSENSLGTSNILTLKKSHFYKNRAELGGGVFDQGLLNIEGTNFTGNRAEKGGALFFWASGRARAIQNTIFLKNNAVNDGGAIYAASGLTDQQDEKLRVVHGSFYDNRTARGSGGGIFASMNTEVVNSILWNNKARDGGKQIEFVPGFYLKDKQGNALPGIFAKKSFSKAINSMAFEPFLKAIDSGNFVPIDRAKGEASWSYHWVLSLLHSNLEGGLKGIIDEIHAPVEISNFLTGPGFSLSTRHPVKDLGGNLNQNPRFALEEDLQLLADSPSIDAGATKEVVKDLSEYDSRGYARSVDGRGNGKAIPDMGAYEYRRKPQPALGISPRFLEVSVREGVVVAEGGAVEILNLHTTDVHWASNEQIQWLQVDRLEGIARGMKESINFYTDPKKIFHPERKGLFSGIQKGSMSFTDETGSVQLGTIQVFLRLTRELYVPTQYRFIQDAIDAAQDGDEVVVGPGMYANPRDKNLDFLGKTIIVRSARGPQETIIDCQQSGRGVHFQNLETSESIFQGFTIQNCKANSGPRGGAAILIDGSSSPTILNSIFLKNSSIYDGAGLAIYGQNVHIGNSVFKENISDSYGGGLAVIGDYTTIDRCQFSKNTAKSGGGLISTGDFMVIQSSVFEENKATGDSSQNAVGGGGGVNAHGDSLTIQHSRFLKNSALMGGGGLALSGKGAREIVNTLFLENFTTKPLDNRVQRFWGGGGLSIDDGNVRLVNSTFTKNHVREGANGGGIRVWWGKIDIVNTILWENTEGENVNAFRVSDLSVAFQGGLSVATGTNNTISDTQSYPLGAAGNLDCDPQFVIQDNGDHLLGPDSLCRDAGVVIPGLFSDIRGSVRQVEANQNGIPEFDVGAFEYSEFYGGPQEDQPSKAFKEVQLGGAFAMTNFPYRITWKDKDPFPFDTRIRQFGQYDVTLALQNDHGRRIELTRETVTVAQQGYSIPYTFSSQHLGTWRLRVELTSDPNQFALSEPVTIKPKDGVEYVLGQEIPPPSDADSDQKPDVQLVNGQDPTYWSVDSHKLFAIAPMPTIITWYADQERARPIPVVALITHPTNPQLHIANSLPVDLLPEGTIFDSVTQKYSDSAGNLSAKHFTASREGWSVLLYRDEQATDVQEKEHFEVVRTIDWNQPNIQVNQWRNFPIETPWDIGKAVHDVCPIDDPSCRVIHEPACGNGYVFFEQAPYDGYGEQRAHDRLTRKGPIFPVNKDLTAPIGDESVDPLDDLVVLWYERNTQSQVCWPAKSVRYQPKWPDEAPVDPVQRIKMDTIVIASAEGSGPLTPSTFGAPDQMLVYHQSDPSLPGYNPNEEHADFFTAQGSEYLGIFPLRTDLNSARTSDPYVLLKYQEPVSLEWTFKVFKVEAESPAYVRAADGQLIVREKEDRRYYLDEMGTLQEQGLRYTLTDDGYLQNPYVSGQYYTFRKDRTRIEPVDRWNNAPKYYLDKAGKLTSLESAAGCNVSEHDDCFFLDKYHRLRHFKNPDLGYFNFDDHTQQILSVTGQDLPKQYMLTVSGQLIPAAMYYLEASPVRVNDEETGQSWRRIKSFDRRDREICYNLDDSRIIPTECEGENDAKLKSYFINEAGLLQQESLPSADVHSRYALDQQGVLVQRDLYHRFHYPGVAGEEINAPYPLNQLVFGPCPQTAVVESSKPWVLKDKDNKLFAKNGGFKGTPTLDIAIRFFYRLKEGFYPTKNEQGEPVSTVGSCIPWLDGWQNPLDDTPSDTTYAIRWPDVVPTLHVGETLTDAKTQEGESVGLPAVMNQDIVAVAFDQARERSDSRSKYAVNLLDPRKELAESYPLGNPEQELPKDLKPKIHLKTQRIVFQALPYDLQVRLTYDRTTGSDPATGKSGELKLRGFLQKGVGEPELLLNVLTERDLVIIETLLEKDEKKEIFLTKVKNLQEKAKKDLGYPGWDEKTPKGDGYPVMKEVELKALSAGDAKGTGYVTLVFN